MPGAGGLLATGGCWSHTPPNGQEDAGGHGRAPLSPRTTEGAAQGQPQGPRGTYLPFDPNPAVGRLDHAHVVSPVPCRDRSVRWRESLGTARGRCPGAWARRREAHRQHTCAALCGAAAASRHGPSGWASSGSTRRPGTGTPAPPARARSTSGTPARQRRSPRGPRLGASCREHPRGPPPWATAAPPAQDAELAGAAPLGARGRGSGRCPRTARHTEPPKSCLDKARVCPLGREPGWRSGTRGSEPASG